jgi:WD40 repeat protein
MTSAQLGRSLIGHKEDVTSVCLLTAGERPMVISTSKDATVRLWDAETGGQLSIFVADSPIESAVVSPNGRMIVVGCHSGSIHFLSLEKEASYTS